MTKYRRLYLQQKPGTGFSRMLRTFVLFPFFLALFITAGFLGLMLQSK